MIRPGFNRVRDYLAKGIRQGLFPGVVCWIGSRRAAYYEETLGFIEHRPAAAPMTADTVFDVASLTKPLVTAMACMKAIAGGELELDDTAGSFFPAFRRRSNAAITVRDLLTHTSGLPDWLPMYLVPRSRRLTFLGGLPAGRRQVRYSCPGYMILGWIVEKIYGSTLDRIGRDLYRGLNVETTGFKPTLARTRIAPTEDGDIYERIKASRLSGFRSRARTWSWRDRLIRGEVHDGNAYYAGGGVLGNAGLFSSAPDLVRIMRAYLEGALVPTAAMRVMTTDQTGGKDRRGLGWKMDIYPGVLARGSFGHTGFTGTMLCYDPDRDLLVVLLTNAVNPRVRSDRMPGFRKMLMAEVVRTVQRRR